MIEPPAGWSHSTDRSPYENLVAAVNAFTAEGRVPPDTDLIEFASANIAGLGSDSAPKSLSAMREDGHHEPPDAVGEQGSRALFEFAEHVIDHAPENTPRRVLAWWVVRRAFSYHSEVPIERAAKVVDAALKAREGEWNAGVTAAHELDH